MKILFVCSYRSYAIHTYYMAPFIYEQLEALRKKNIKCSVLQIKSGIFGYIYAFFRLLFAIVKFKPDLVHAHFGLCGFLANLQRFVPVITTYHGSDINDNNVFHFSKYSIKLSAYNIFVSNQLFEKAGNPQNSVVIPCGVDTDVFYPMDKISCREQLGLRRDKYYVLFSKMFTDPIKNYPLAKRAIDICDNTELIEYIGFSREQAPLLFNACDAVIMTSFSEGSPQFIKEALACEVPIVSVRVGDVPNLIESLDNCFLCDYDEQQLANAIKKTYLLKKTNSRDRIKNLNLDQTSVIKNILSIYDKVAH